MSVQDRHSNVWLNDLEASSSVRNIILHGYRIPFVALLWPVFKYKHCSAIEQSTFVTAAICELVDTECVVPCAACPITCSPLSVAENANGMMRLMIDLRYINRFFPEEKFR